MTQAGTDGTLNTDHPDVGRRLGAYEIKGLLGEGGMGLVYYAVHTRLGRRVAIKRLKDRLAARPDKVREFFEEARSVNRIKHPHIVEITDFVEEDGLAYCVMELLEGQTLSQLIKNEGPLDVRRAQHIAHQVADALHAAHEAGLVHRDIKPSNIFLIERDERADFVKLLDFGVAALTADLEDGKGGGDPSHLAGTPVYMAPEQTRGEASPQSDIYSLGAVIYQMLSGHPPFTGRSTAELIYKHFNVVPAPLSGMKGLPRRVSSHCNQVVLQCLAKEPPKRFASADALRRALERVGIASGIMLRIGEAPVLTHRPARWRWIAAAAVVALIVAGGAAATLIPNDEPPAAGPSGNKAPTQPQSLEDAPKPKPVVTLKVQTMPEGAEVTHAGPGGSPLGVTPLRVTTAVPKRAWKLVIRKAGYRARTLDVDLRGGSQQLTLTLSPILKPPPMRPFRSKRVMIAPAPGPAMTKKRRRFRRIGSGTIDPFGE